MMKMLKFLNGEMMIRIMYLLEEVGIKPTVSYLLKVRNQDEQMLHEEHAAAKHEEKGAEHKEEHHS